MIGDEISIKEFELVRRFFFEASGIRLNDTKRSLVCGRLCARLRKLNLPDYASYMHFIAQPGNHTERQQAIDLLTTNETYFFREPKHFAFLDKLLEKGWPGQEKTPEIWSAACSSGEEPYSIAMLLQHHYPRRIWKIQASDLSTRMLETAKEGLYPMARAREMPTEFLKAYCLKGQGEYDGWLMVDESIRQHVQFRQLNLTEPLPNMGPFDLIFLRNVLIYFEPAVKKLIVNQLVAALKPEGYLFVGHSESLNGMCDDLIAIQPAIYQQSKA